MPNYKQTPKERANSGSCERSILARVGVDHLGRLGKAERAAREAVMPSDLREDREVGRSSLDFPEVSRRFNKAGRLSSNGSAIRRVRFLEGTCPP